MFKFKAILFIYTVFLCSLALRSQIPNYIPLNGLLAWYPFSGNANDLYVNTHNGIVNGPALTTDRFNSPGCAYLYDGINDYISIADNAANFRPQSFTISSWVLFNVMPPLHRMILAKNIAGNGYEESIDLNYAGNLGSWFCNIGSPAMNGPYLTPPFTLTTGTWYNLVYMFDDVNNIQKIYLNGAFVSSSIVNMSVGYDSQPWTIGTEYEYGSLSYFFNGKIDDIGIWDRILTPCEISQVYLASLVGPTLSASSATICEGQTAVLSVGGASSYTWFPGNLSGPTLSVNPNVTTTYSVTGSNTLGCSASKTVNVLVNPAPQVTLVGSPGSVCAGNPVVLIASGAAGYTWNPGNSYGSAVQIFPATNTVYTVTASSAAGCTVVNSIPITVNANPVISVSGLKGIICAGTSVVINASGANTYTWSTQSNNSSITISPGVTTTYTVSGTNTNGCEGFTTVTQYVTICDGVESMMLTNELSPVAFPNPFDDMLVIEIPQSTLHSIRGDINVELLNELGQLVLREKCVLENNRAVIRTDALARGAYILKVVLVGAYYHLKVIKN